MTTYLYRVQIIEQPEWELRMCFEHQYSSLHEEWKKYQDYFPCPVGWEPSAEYVDRFKTDKWIEPALDKGWRSRSSAAARRDILVGAGYKAIVQRSSPVVWPVDGEGRVDDSEVSRVRGAIRVLKRAGLIRSADEIFG